MPQMSLPVLFDEISTELGLSLVQIGWIWGLGSMLGILVGLIGGPVGDRFGPRRTLAVACIFMGITGAARGLSNGFTMLVVTTLITGFAQWSIPMNIHKTCGIWFSKKQLGMANVFAPPVGNWLAKFGPGCPFLFWAALVFSGFVGYFFMRPTAEESACNTQAQN
jgi:sugar phosphate permease